MSFVFFYIFQFNVTGNEGRIKKEVERDKHIHRKIRRRQKKNSPDDHSNQLLIYYCTHTSYPIMLYTFVCIAMHCRHNKREQKIVAT